MNVATIIRLSAIVSLVLSSALAGNQRPETDPEPATIVGFDNYPANRSGTPAADPIVDFYRDRGLLFVRGVTALLYNDESVPADPNFARSGDTVITSCYAAEFCTNNIEMELLVAHRRVGLWVGYDGTLRSAANLLLIGFDRDRTPVARQSLTMGPSDRRIPVSLPISIEDPQGRITSLQLAWADQRSFLAGLSVDDIELTPFVADPVTETTEEQPPDSSVTTDDVPADSSVTTAATPDTPVTTGQPPETPVTTNGGRAEPAADGDPWRVSTVNPLVPILVLGIVLSVTVLPRRRGRGQRRQAPPSTPPDRPAPPVRSPKIRIRADDGDQDLANDGKPLVAIRASLDLRGGETEITDHGGEPAPPIVAPNGRPRP